VLFASPEQINFQIPWETAIGTANVTVSVAGMVGNSVSVPVVAAGPGLFYSEATGAAIVQNYPSYSLNSPSNPAATGSYIIAYLTGSGPVSPAVADGVAAPSGTLTYATSSVSATIGGKPVPTVGFAGLAPGFVGLVQVDLLVPSGLTAGTYPLVVTIDGQSSNAGKISVQQQIAIIVPPSE